MSHLPVPEISKRERDPLTEALIKQAFEEEQQRKKAKKGGFEGEHGECKGACGHLLHDTQVTADLLRVPKGCVGLFGGVVHCLEISCGGAAAQDGKESGWVRMWV